MNIDNLLKLLHFQEEEWDFEGIKTTYYQLSQIDDYYYIELLCWLADSSFIDDLCLLLQNQGTLFFFKYKDSKRVAERQVKAIEAILRWFNNTFLPIKYKLINENKSISYQHEKYILDAIHHGDIDNLEKYIIKNKMDLFFKKKCREMVLVYALGIIYNLKSISLDICILALKSFKKPLRCRRIIKILIKNINFLDVNTINDLLIKIHVLGHSKYGRELTGMLYSILNEKIQYVFSAQSIQAQTINMNRKPKVAVCISGMTRGVNISIKSLYDNIVMPLNANVFLSTWDIMETWPGITGAFKIRRTFGNICSILPKELLLWSNILKYFPNVYSVISTRIISDFSLYFYTQYLDITSYKIENESLFLNSLPFPSENLLYDGQYNQAKMFYKIYSAIQLVLEYENKMDFKYDYIVRTRPDSYYNGHITLDILRDIRENEILMNYLESGPNDYFWIGRRDAMINMCSTWEQIIKTENFNIFKDISCKSHKFIELYIAKQGLTTVGTSLKAILSGATQDIALNIKEALEKDFATTAAIYKDNEDVKKFFRFIAKNDSVC